MTDDMSTLRQAAERLEPDVDRLVAGGTARGRRLQRRRRVGGAIAAAAVVGLVAAGAAVVPSLLDDPSGPEAGYAGGTAEPSPDIDATPTTPSAPSPDVDGARWDPSVRAKELPGLVTRLFPGKVTPADERTGRIMNGGESFQVAHFRWDGFLTSVGATSAGDAPPLKRCRENLGEGMSCDQRPDGSVLLTWTQTGPAADGAVTGRGVQLYVPGWDVFAISYNAADGKDSPVLAPEPPFTLEQLTAVVDDPAWFD